MTRKNPDAGWLPVRMLRLHLKLFACLALGALTIPLLPASWPLAARLIGGWDIAAILYLAVVFFSSRRARSTRSNGAPRCRTKVPARF